VKVAMILKSAHERTDYCPKISICSKSRAGHLLVMRVRRVEEATVLRRLAQRHRPRAAQSGYRRSENRRVVRLQALEERRVLRWQSQQSAV